jgi:hypothetical protein
MSRPRVGVSGIPVTIFGGTARSSLRRLGTVRTGANGTFAYTRPTGGLSYFPATAAALACKSETGCTVPGRCRSRA